MGEIRDTIRWGIIGCGDVAESKSGPPLYQTPRSELVAVMRRDAEQAAEFARRHAVARWYTDVQSLLTDFEVNAVYVATPHGLHAEHVRAAALAGKMVVCEKPMGTSSAEAQAMVDVCRECGVPLAVAYYRRFWEITQKVKTLLGEGAIGGLINARIQLADFFQGDRDRSWMTSKEEAGGGALANAGSHWVDLVRYLFGDVDDVLALVSSGSGFPVEDTAAALLRLRTGGFVSLMSTWRSRVSANELDVLGTDGRIVVDSLSAGRMSLLRANREPECFEFARAGPAHREYFEALIPALSAGEKPAVPGEDGVAAWEVIEACYASFESGCRTRVGGLR